MTRFLYHGTTERALASIKRRGLRPRKKGTKGNYANAISGSDLIYLTDCYAIFYAGNAAKGKDRLAVLQIDMDKLDPTAFLADEDFIAQCLTKQMEHDGTKDNRCPKSRLRYCRDFIAPSRPDLAMPSLDMMGTIAYRGIIPADAITQVALMTGKDYGKVVVHGHDPSTGVLNHQLLGGRYEGWLAWLFGLPVDYIDLFTKEPYQYPDIDKLDVERRPL